MYCENCAAKALDSFSSTVCNDNCTHEGDSLIWTKTTLTQENSPFCHTITIDDSVWVLKHADCQIPQAKASLSSSPSHESSPSPMEVENPEPEKDSPPSPEPMDTEKPAPVDDDDSRTIDSDEEEARNLAAPKPAIDTKELAKEFETPVVPPQRRYTVGGKMPYRSIGGKAKMHSRSIGRKAKMPARSIGGKAKLHLLTQKNLESWSDDEDSEGSMSDSE